MSNVTMTEATGLNLFVCTMEARQGEYTETVKRLVRADNIDLAVAYVFNEGMPFFHSDEVEDAGERCNYNENTFYYFCGDLALTFKHLVPVDADKVHAVEIASNMGLIDFM